MPSDALLSSHVMANGDAETGNGSVLGVTGGSDVGAVLPVMNMKAKALKSYSSITRRRLHEGSRKEKKSAPQWTHDMDGIQIDRRILA